MGIIKRHQHKHRNDSTSLTSKWFQRWLRWIINQPTGSIRQPIKLQHFHYEDRCPPSESLGALGISALTLGTSQMMGLPDLFQQSNPSPVTHPISKILGDETETNAIPTEFNQDSEGSEEGIIGWGLFKGSDNETSHDEETQQTSAISGQLNDSSSVAGSGNERTHQTEDPDFNVSNQLSPDDSAVSLDANPVSSKLSNADEQSSSARPTQPSVNSNTHQPTSISQGVDRPPPVSGNSGQQTITPSPTIQAKQRTYRPALPAGENMGGYETPTGPGFTEHTITTSVITNITEGSEFTKELGQFDSVTGAEYWEFTAMVNWGDSTPVERVKIEAVTSNRFRIVGTHQYDDEKLTNAGYQVTIEVKGTDGSIYSGALNIVVSDATINNVPLLQNYFPSTELNQEVVGRFHSNDPNVQQHEFVATVDWGDGEQSQGTIVSYGGGNFAVLGSHQFEIPSVFGYTPPAQVTITVTSEGSSTCTWVETISFQSSGSTNNGTSQSQNTNNQTSLPEIVLTEGVDWEGLKATFFNIPPSTDLTYAQAVIYWGDGTVDSSGSVTEWCSFNVNGSDIEVYGKHRYVANGFYQMRIELRLSPMDYQSMYSISGSVIVHAAPIGLSLSRPELIEGQSINDVVARFSTVDLSASASDFTAVIDWGNGRLTSGTVQAVEDQPGQFQILGQMLYPHRSATSSSSSQVALELSVRVWSSSGASAFVKSTVSTAEPIKVKDAPLSVHLTQNSYSTMVGREIKGYFAGFDDGAFDPKSDFSATINWGDGTETPAEIKSFDERLYPDFDPNRYGGWYGGWWGWTGNWYGDYVNGGSGRFLVYSDHTYEQAGNYTVTITVKDNVGDEEKTRTIAMYVSEQYPYTISSRAPDPEITVTSVSSSAPITEGESINRIVASFTDSTSSYSSGHYALIDWGDGSIVGGSIDSQTGNVTGTHIYQNSGSYAVKVWISKNYPYWDYTTVGWTSTTQQLTVLEAPIDAISISGQLNELTTSVFSTLTNVDVATFTSQDSSLTEDDVLARINWGDGVSEWGNVSITSGSSSSSSGSQNTSSSVTFTVRGSHGYTQAGNWPISVDFFDVKDQQLPESVYNWPSTASVRSAKSVNGTVVVDDIMPSMPPSSPMLVIDPSVSAEQVSITELTVPPGMENYVKSRYNARVHWGNGISTQISGSQFEIVSSGKLALKSYPYHFTPGKFRTLVLLERIGQGVIATTENEVEVLNPAPIPSTSGVEIHATPIGHAHGSGLIYENTETGVTLGTIRVEQAIWQKTATRVNISWGDGGSSVGELSLLTIEPHTQAKIYRITGVHRYANPGSFVISLTVDHPCPADAGMAYLAMAQTSATVIEESLSLEGENQETFSLTQDISAVMSGQDAAPWGPFTAGLSNTTIGQFFSDNKGERDFAAQIQWGDGSSSFGIIAGGQGSFQILGSHQYSRPGQYRGNIILTDTQVSLVSSFSVEVKQTADGVPTAIKGGEFFNHYNGSGYQEQMQAWGDQTPSIHDYYTTYWGYGGIDPGDATASGSGSGSNSSTGSGSGSNSSTGSGSGSNSSTGSGSGSNSSTGSGSASGTGSQGTNSANSSFNSSSAYSGSGSNTTNSGSGSGSGSGETSGSGSPMSSPNSQNSSQSGSSSNSGNGQWSGESSNSGSQSSYTPTYQQPLPRNGSGTYNSILTNYPNNYGGFGGFYPWTYGGYGYYYGWGGYSGGYAALGSGFISANHIYDEPGEYTVSSTVIDDAISKTATKHITVSAAPINEVMKLPSWHGVQANTSSANSTSNDRLLVVFKTSDINAAASDFEASLLLSDSQDIIQPARIEKLANNTFAVYGSPSYQDIGQFDLIVSVQRISSNTTTNYLPSLQSVIPAYITPNGQDATTGSSNLTFYQSNPMVKAGSNVSGVELGRILGASSSSNYSISAFSQTLGSNLSVWLDVDPNTQVTRVLANVTTDASRWGTHEIALQINSGYSPILQTKLALNLFTGWDSTLVSRSNDPDRALSVAAGLAEITPNTGSLLLTHALDFDLSPGTSVGGSPSLIYNSATVHVNPVAEIFIRGEFPVPVTHAKITIEGQLPTVVPLNGTPGELGWTIRVPLKTFHESGAYYWKARIELATTDGSTIYDQAADKAIIVVRDNQNDVSPFGAGWGLTGLDRLMMDGCHDLLWVKGSGEARSFPRGTNGGTFNDTTYTSPPEDFGSLIWSVNDAEYVYTALDKTETRFDAGGYITSVTDRRGLRRVYEYDDQRRISKIISPDHGETSFSYQNNSVTILEPGRTIPVTLNLSGGNLVSIQGNDLNRSVRQLDYNGHRLTRDQWYPYDTSFSYQQDTGRLSGFQEGTNGAFRQFISPSDQLGTDGLIKGTPKALIKEGLSHDQYRITEIEMDQRGRELKTSIKLATQGVYNQKILDWNQQKRNSAGDIVKVIDSYYRETSYSYTNYDLTQVSYPDSTSEQFRYDSNFHQLISHQDRRQYTTTYTLNSLGDVTSIINPLNEITTYQYESETKGHAQVGLVKSETLANGVKTTYSYDSHRRVVKSQVPLAELSTNGVTTTIYDVYGNITETINPLHQRTTMIYDQEGRLLSTIDPAQQQTEFTYYASGLTNKVTSPPVSAFNPERPVKMYEYDQRGLLTHQSEGTQTDFLRQDTNVYDALGRLTVQIENVSLSPTLPSQPTVTTFQYDALDHPIVQISGDGQPGSQVTTTRTVYDSIGNILSVTDANQILTTYAYDSMNRQKRVEEGTLLHSIDDVQLGWAYNRYANKTITTYDQNGNTVSSTTGQTNRGDIAIPQVTRTISQYDSMNRPKEVTKGILLTNSGLVDTTKRNASVKSIYEYDQGGNLVTQTDSIPIGTAYSTLQVGVDRHVSTHYEYDLLGNVIKEYHAWGKPEETITVKSYDQLGNIRIQTTGISENDPTRSHPSTTKYDYDQLNRLSELIEAWSPDDAVVNPAGSLHVGRRTTYVYDTQDRVISTTSGQSYAAAYAKPLTTEYRYDSLGNKTAMIEAANDISVQRLSTYQYDSAGNLLSSTTGQSINPLYAKPQTTEYRYNSLGNLVVQIEAAHTIDARKTLFAYDAGGQLISKTEGLLGLSPEEGTQSAQYSAPRIEEYQYNVLGQLIDQHAGYVGDVTNWRRTVNTYDTSGNLLSEWNGAYQLLFNPNPRFLHDNLTRYEYDSLSRRVKSTEAPETIHERISLVEYDSASNVVLQHTGIPKNHSYSPYSNPITTYHEYDAIGNLLKTAVNKGRWDLSASTEWNWSYDNLPGSNIHTTEYRYDSASNLVSTISGLSSNSSTDHRQESRMDYDELNRITSHTEAFNTSDARETRYEYDSSGNERRITTGLSASFFNRPDYSHPILVENFYDTLSRLTMTINASQSEGVRAAASKNINTYDAQGNLRSTTAGISLVSSGDSNILYTEYQYDNLNRVVEISEAPNQIEGRKTLRVYDALDRVTVETSGVGYTIYASPRTTSRSYNAFHQPISIEEAVGVWSSSVSFLGVVTWNYNAGVLNNSYRRTEIVYDANGNQLEITKGLSPIAEYQHIDIVSLLYDELNRVSKIVHGSSAVLNPTGFFIVEELEYDLGDRIVIKTRYDNTQVAYKPNGVSLQQWQFANTERTRYIYDVFGRTIQVINGFITDSEKANQLHVGTAADYYPDGFYETSQTYVYDAANNLIEETDSRGVITSYLYDRLNRRTRITQGSFIPTNLLDGGVTSPIVQQSFYDSQDNLVQQVDGMGVITRYTYNSAGQMVEQKDGGTILPDSTESFMRTSLFHYNARGQLIAQTLGVGVSLQSVAASSQQYPFAKIETAQFLYDVLGRKIQMKQAITSAELATLNHSSPITTWVYDSHDNITVFVQNNLKTAFLYDSLGRNSDIYVGSGLDIRHTSKTFDSSDNVVTEFDLNNLQISRKYDFANRVTQETTGSGFDVLTTNFQYNLFGVTSRTSVIAGTENYYYDRTGKLVWTKSSTSHWLLNRYDHNGNRIQIEDWVKPYYYSSVSNTTPFESDEFRKVITTMTYDPYNRQIKVKDSTGHIVSNSYDNNNRIVSESQLYADNPPYSVPVLRSREFSYDRLGNFTSEIWSEGAGTSKVLIRRMDYVYDAMGNMLLSYVCSNPNNQAAGMYDLSWTERTFDSLNRLSSSKNSYSGLVSYVYDIQSQLLYTTSSSARRDYGYDLAGRPISYTLTPTVAPSSAHSVQSKYVPNGVGELTDFVDYYDYYHGNNHKLFVDLFQNNFGKETKRQFFSVTPVTTQSPRSDTLVDQVSTEYYPATQFVKSINRNGKLITSYEYNNQQISKLSHTYSSPALGSSKVTTFVYDPVGNPIFKSYADAINVTTGYRQTSDGQNTIQYDSAGNIVEIVNSSSSTPEAWLYTYDHMNRLTLAQKGAYNNDTPRVFTPYLTVSYDYNAESELIRRTLTVLPDSPVQHDEYQAPLSVGTSVKHFQYDRGQLLAVLLAPNVVVSFMTDSLGQVLFSHNNTSFTYLYQHDSQGNVIGLLSDSGEQMKTIFYEGTSVSVRKALPAFSTEPTSVVHDSIELSSRYSDFVTNLQYRDGRWLRLDGSWLNADPMGATAGDPNQYRYAFNNYVNASTLARSGPMSRWQESFEEFKNVGAMVYGFADGFTLNIHSTLLNNFTSFGPQTWSSDNQKLFEYGSAFGTVASLFVPGPGVFNALRIPSVASKIARTAQTVRKGSTLKQYSDWSLRNQNSNMALSPNLAHTAGVIGTGIQAYGSAQLMSYPFGFISKVSPIAPYAILPFAVNEVASLGRKAFDSSQPWYRRAESAAELLAGSAGGFTKNSFSFFASGARHGQALATSNSIVRAISNFDKAFFNPILDPLIHKGIGSVSDKWHVRASAWAEKHGYKACFGAGTPIRTPDGYSNIEDIREGDVVLSRDEYDPSGQVEPKRVEELFVRTAPILRLRVNGRDIATTAEHPFYALGKGWTNAEELVCQDQLLDVDGRWHLVQDVVNTNELTTVYNFRVQDYHTYFVGCDEWGFSVWAHNATYAERLGEAKVAALETARAGLSVPIAANQWKGILASAFRGRAWQETAVTRLRESLVRRGVPVHEIDNVVTTVTSGTRLADARIGTHVDLTIPSRRVHILDGDPPPAVQSGGHRFGQGVPGKSEFPAWWTDDRIIGNVSDIASHPTTVWRQVDGPGAGSTHVGGFPMGLTTRAGDPVRFRATEVRDGVSIRVVYDNAHGEGIITGVPMSGRGVRRNPT